jgi:pimeloyl-ACP methyl ester carboxylesterase
LRGIFVEGGDISMSAMSRLGRDTVGRILGLVLVVAVTGCSLERAGESLTLLQDVSEAAGSGKDEPSRTPPFRKAISFSVDARTYEADFYRPGAEAPVAAVVLIPGAAPDGKDDRRLVAFAGALTRAKFAVLVPEIANLRDMRVAPEDVTATADAVTHLSERIGGDPVGLIVVSYSVGPALIAATQDTVRENVGFLVAIGGYADMERLVVYFTTGYFRDTPTEEWRFMPPNPRGKWLFLRSNLERIENPDDRRRLQEIARRRFRDSSANIDDLAAGLGDEGKSILALMTNQDPDRVPALLADLPPLILEDMERLNPARSDLTKLSARLVLIHGRDDRVIPFTESRALETTLAESGAVDLYLVDNLAHVDLAPPGLWDRLMLWRAAYRVLEIRDSMPAMRPLTNEDPSLFIQ